MTDPTQTVATETEASPQATAEAPGARDDGSDLTTLLKEFDDATAPKPQPQPTQPTTPNPSEERLAAVERLLFDRDFNEAVKSVLDGLDVSPKLAKGFINEAANENPKLKEIFDKRASDPGRWAKALSALKGDFAKELGKRTDPAATADRDAVAAAVKVASSNKAPEDRPPSYGSMSDAEFTREKAKLGF